MNCMHQIHHWIGSFSIYIQNTNSHSRYMYIANSNRHMFTPLDGYNALSTIKDDAIFYLPFLLSILTNDNVFSYKQTFLL